MIDHEAEMFVRDTFRDHERLADGAAARLLPAVRMRTRRRGTIRLAGVAVAALGVLVGTAVTLSVAPAAGPSPSPSPSVSQGTVPPGWRVESSIGAEVAVPADWVLDDYGCGMTDAPTVIRFGLMSHLFCFTAEPPGKQIVSFQGSDSDDRSMPLPLFAGLAERGVLIDGVTATRAEGRLDDGRYAGWVRVPARQFAVVVKTLEPATTRQILDSVRVLDTIDHAGCPVREPAPAPGPGAAGATFVTPDPTAVSICYYGGTTPLAPLIASARVSGENARHLASVLNAAAPGPNPDVSWCKDAPPQIAEMVLRLWSGDTITDSVWITYSSCTQRGLFNGADRAQMTHTLLGLIRDHVHAGYHLKEDIPQ